MEQGKWVRAAGRASFANGVTVPLSALAADATKQTLDLISAGNQVVINGRFTARGLTVRVDCVKVVAKGVEITLIRSGSSVKDEYLRDAAIVLACAIESGVEVVKFTLMLPNTKVARGNGTDGSEVFGVNDVTQEVEERAKDVWSWVSECSKTLDGEAPVCESGEHCTSVSPCPFQSHCGESLVEDAALDSAKFLPVKTKSMKSLMKAGCLKMSDMPEQDLQIERNAVVYAAVMEGKGVVSRKVRDQIRALPYPRSFIDFEAVMFAIPRFEGMRPYQALPFQWSCHSKMGEGSSIVHEEFIDVSGNDPRRGFIESLLNSLADTGVVMVYSSYERSRLKELALDFPEFQDRIESLILRLVDVLELARLGYYHADMKGSWSLKKVAPTLPKCEDLLAYSEMGDVADGMGAQAAYFEQIDPEIIGIQKEIRLTEMKEYCKADTRGLMHFMDCMESANEPVSFGDGNLFGVA
jgi:hypothetical protein